MSDPLRGNKRSLVIFALAVILLAAVLLLGFTAGWLPAALLLAVSGWSLVLYTAARAGRPGDAKPVEIPSPPAEALRRLDEAEQERARSERRLRAVVDLNRSLAGAASDALDEHGLMESSLSTLTRLVGALGCSFVPVDEWQQPLPPFTFGRLPAPVLSAWSSHLANHMLAERCGSCQVMHSSAGACPLHPEQVGDALTVYCLPLDRLQNHHPGQAENTPVHDPRSGRPLGVLHLYMPPGQAVDADTRAFVESLLPELALAYESARLRSQEASTMRQLQMLHAPEGDFAASLGGLLEGMLRALGADFAIIRLRATADERMSSLNVQRGMLEGLPADKVDGLLDRSLEALLRGETAASAPGSVPAWLALPLLLPEAAVPAGLSREPDGQPAAGRLTGLLLAGANYPFTFHPRQQAILQTVAAQAALLVENERIVRSLEYKVVIQERARLAREIHDGLAQTLAYLKLQSAQMQTYLAQGDVARLSQVLKDNYQALAEAYLDTRQAIDNLRLTPREGLRQWIERAARDFENSAGLHINYSIQPLEHAIAPEVQVHLIRVVQEALNNVRKHARAQHVTVSLREWLGELVLEVSDDGLGFAAEDVPEESRHGLRGMRERAEMIGADFQIVSQERQGTTVRLVLPDWFEEEPSK